LSNDLWILEYSGYVKVLPRLDFSDHRLLLICPVNVHRVVPMQLWFKSDRLSITLIITLRSRLAGIKILPSLTICIIFREMSRDGRLILLIRSKMKAC